MTVTIYHNPRCSKSRKTLELIRQQNISPNIIEYLKADLTRCEIEDIVKALNTDVRSILRQSEKAYKVLNLEDTGLSEQALINAILENPELLQRPVVVSGSSAVIGRPPEKVLEIL